MALGPTIVFVDSNVLYSRTLRDWTCQLMESQILPPLFRLRWTEDVLADTIHHLRKDHPRWDGGMTRAVADNIRDALGMEQRVDDYTADENYDGRDPHDLHVHSAAVACGADYLLTADKDFDDLDSSPYETIHPDDFFVLVNGWAPSLTRDVTHSQMRYWAARRDEARLCEYLESAGCPQFAHLVRAHIAAIGGIPLGPVTRA